MKRSIKNVSKTKKRRIRKRARRTKLADVPRQVNLDAVEKLYASRLIDRQVAEALGLSERTLNRYKHNPSFMAVVEKGRESVIKEVRKSLIQKCIGYNYAEVTMEPVLAIRQQDGVKSKVMLSQELAVTKSVIKHIPADESAIEFYLTNLDRKNFKKRVDLTSGDKPIEPRMYVVPAFDGRIALPK